MEKFPEHYKKPQLLDVTKAAVTGWTAACSPGDSASTSCSIGGHFAKLDEGFIPPEVLQQGF